MLFFLLIIIAIGVFLVSQVGRNILKIIIGLIFSLTMVFILILIFSDEGIRETVFSFGRTLLLVFGGVSLIGILFWEVYGVYLDIKNGHYSIEDVLQKPIEMWKENKIVLTLPILSLIFIVLTLFITLIM